MAGFLLIVLCFVLAALAAALAMQPNHFRVSRSARIAAPPNLVFDKINELRNWERWSPWAKLDPNAKNSYAGPEAGSGAAFEWSSTTPRVGAGRMTIVDSRPGQSVNLLLEMQKPFGATSDVSFTLTPDHETTPSRGGWWFSRLLGFEPDKVERVRTVVTWTVSGRSTIVSRVMNLFTSCDAGLGAQLEQGLSNLQAAFPEEAQACEESAERRDPLERLVGAAKAAIGQL